MTEASTPLAISGHRLMLARVLPFAVYMVWLALRPVLSAWLGPQIAPWLYAAQIASVMIVLAAFFKDYVELLRPAAVPVRMWLAAVGLGVAVFVAWIHLDFAPFAMGGGQGMAPPMRGGGIDWVWISVRIFGAAVIVPIMEELFWRSFVMRWIDQRDFLKLAPVSVSLRALLASSFVFGLEHSLWFAGLLAGLAYGWLFKQGNLRLAVLSHGLTNLLLGLWVVHTAQWQFW